MLYIGVDLGTSAVKLLLMDEKGAIRNIVSEEYPISFPHPGWSEQNPEDWLKAVLKGIRELTANEDKSKIAGIGAGGQMHGLVVLDRDDRVLRPAILWNDGRTQEETDYLNNVILNNVIGKKKLTELTGNIAFTGFTAPKILWMKKHEPDLFARIDKIMLPKDYINYMLTGTNCTDYSDASGMLLLDVKNKRWSREMLSICGIRTGVRKASWPSGDGEALRRSGRQRGCCRRNRRRRCGRMQYFARHIRDDLHFRRGHIPRRFGKCTACVRARGRRLPSHGLHALGRILQQMVDGRDHPHERLSKGAGGHQ